MQPPVNDGTKVYTLLVEYNLRTGQPTGRIKPNVPSDPNYIAPVTDLSTCPLPGDPVIPQRDIVFNILDFTVTVSLQYGVNHVDRSGPNGTWTVVDRTYDGVLFDITNNTVQSYILQVKYNNNSSIKQIEASGTGSFFIPGPLPAISHILILSNTGDYNDDYNDDFYN